MPYFQLRDTLSAAVELQGNSAAELQAAMTKHGSIAQPLLAIAWVQAFFTRRSHQISKQKAEQAGDEAAADAAYERMVEAEQREEAARSAYLAAVAGTGNSHDTNTGRTAESAQQQPTAAASSGGLYGDVKQEGGAAAGAAEEEEFM